MAEGGAAEKAEDNAAATKLKATTVTTHGGKPDGGVGGASRKFFSSGSMLMVAAVGCLLVGSAFVASGGAGSSLNGTLVIERSEHAPQRRKLTAYDRLLQSEPEPEDGSGGDASKEDALIAKIAEKLQPVSLRFKSDEEDDGVKEIGETEDGQLELDVETVQKKDEGKDQKEVMVPHQFLHLHHMKTGGTSIDKLLRCSMKRLRDEANYDVPYYSIHECSRKRFASCLTDGENKCREYMNNAAVMSYCSALKYLDEFGWWYDEDDESKKYNKDVKAFTVLRHPVDRVWSMFRFQTKNCFQCTELKEIYKLLDDSKGDPQVMYDRGYSKGCLDQLRNHQTANLLSTEWALDVTEANDLDENGDNDKNAMVQEAIENMKNFFTVIGITEEMPETANTLAKVFPWLNATETGEGTTSTCELPHANGAPKNNRCEPGGKHWFLSDTPDEETRNMILKHNTMDILLYEAAASYFELQKKALKLV